MTTEEAVEQIINLIKEHSQCYIIPEEIWTSFLTSVPRSHDQKELSVACMIIDLVKEALKGYWVGHYKWEPNECDVIENTCVAKKEHGSAYGAGNSFITKEQIKALQDGKVIAMDINGGEYVEFLSMDKPSDEGFRL